MYIHQSASSTLLGITQRNKAAQPMKPHETPQDAQTLHQQSSWRLAKEKEDQRGLCCLFGGGRVLGNGLGTL